MTMPQDNYFVNGEGDAWFKRNETYLTGSIDTDWPLSLMAQYGLNPKTVLEVGCSNGWRLGKILQQQGDVRCVGVEPSQEAIADGKKRYPAIEFHQGAAAAIPLQEQFDVVIVNFVLHWIDRATLLKSVAEIDRMVKDGGYLIIGDFLPDSPCRSFYHHLPTEKVYTYKLHYPKLFAASGLYSVVADLSYNHADRKLLGTVPSHNRAGCAVLRKSLDEFYPEFKLPA